MVISRNIGVTYQAGTIIPNIINKADIPVVMGKTNNESQDGRPTDGTHILQYSSYEEAAKPIEDGGIGAYDTPKADITIFIDDGKEMYRGAAIQFVSKEDPTKTYNFQFDEESSSYYANIPIGDYKVHITGGDFEAYEKDIKIENALVTIRYDLQRTTNVTFKIKGSPVTYPVDITVIDNNKNPIEGAVVNIGTDVVLTNNKGVAAFSHLPAASYRVYVLSTGKKPSYTDITVQYKEVSATVMLNQDVDTHKATITVRNSEGAGVAGATVTLEDTTSVKTKSNGEAEINHLPDGTYNVRVTANGYSVSSDTVEVKGEDATKTITLAPATNKLKNDESSNAANDTLVPIVDAQVQLGDVLLGQGADGVYIANDYPQGSADLRIVREGYQLAAKTVNISGSEYTQNVVIKTTTEGGNPEFETPTITPGSHGHIIPKSITPREKPIPVLKPNPVLERLKEYFEENKPMTATDLESPYVYVIDLGYADVKDVWLKAFNKSKSVPEAFWEIYIGMEDIVPEESVDPVVYLMNEASKSIDKEEHNLILREGICICPDGTTDDQHIKYCRNDIPHITFVEEKKKGIIACNRIITSPINKEPGSLDIKTLSKDEIRLRSPQEIKDLYFNGATFITSERNTREEHIRINLAVTSEFNNKDYPPRSILQSVRIYNALLREMFTELQDFLKQNETEIYISMAQSVVNNIVERYANNNFVRLFSAENPNGTKLEIIEDLEEEDGLLVSGNIQPVSTVKSIKVYSTITKRTLLQY